MSLDPIPPEFGTRRRLYELTRTREDYRRAFERRAKPPEPAPPSAPCVGPLALDADAYEAVRACRHRCQSCKSMTCRGGLRDGQPATLDACLACVRRVPPDPLPGATVAVVVAARNCGPWLREAMESVRRQSRPVQEVVYVDDASDDGSAEILRGDNPEYLRVVRSDRHRGVCHARNAGLAATTADFVVHLDGDDTLAPNYVERHLAAFAADPSASLAYCPARLFGDGSAVWPARPWDEAKLRDGNYIHTSAMIRRSALTLAGGWREGIGTAWDWDLWLRIADAGGYGVPVPDTRLHYRQHPGSISRAQGLTEAAGHDRLAHLMRVAHARPAVCVVLSDRLPGLWDRWFDLIGRCVRTWRDHVRAIPTFPPFGAPVVPDVDLVILYTGERWRLPEVHRHAGHAARTFGDVSVMAERFDPPGSGLERAEHVARFLARSYNRFLDMPNRLLWFVEDDVFPPPDALVKLAGLAIGGVGLEPVVSGWYRNRHGRPHVIGNARDESGRYRPVAEPGPGLHRWDLTGTGCLMLWKPALSHRFTSHWKDAAAHDFAYTSMIPGGVAVLGELECRHMVNERDHV